jgi:hypothetical protein
MAVMVRLFVLASLFVAATAHAQAPGEMAPGNPCGSCDGGAVHESYMAHRWSVGLSVGSLSVAPKANPDNKTEFGIGELALRYRATQHLELELALGGGREKLADGTQGDREANFGVLGARYRFNPGARWNWWVMGGLGGISVASQYASDQERKATERPMGQLGVGLERRFERFALQIELRGVGVGKRDNSNDVQPATGAGGAPGMTTTKAGTPVPPPPPLPPPNGMNAPEGQSGGQLTIGASYYF